jgi:hypothetical protein
MWEPVAAEQVDLILQRQFGSALERIGFQPTSRRRWSRSRAPDMRDLFEVTTIKGATLSPRWGFSLDFCPHVTAAGVKWHRTAKSAMFDVVDDPIDTTRVEDLELNPLFMFTMHGSARLEQAAVASAEASLRAATKFWEQVHDERDLLGVVEMLRSRPVVRFGFDNYVQHPVALAFTLARVGRVEDARTELQKAHAYSAGSAVVRSRLDRLLEDAAPRGDRHA